MTRSGTALAPALGSGLESTSGVYSLRAETKRYGRDLALDLVVERILHLRDVSGAAIAVNIDDHFLCIASAGVAPPIGSIVHRTEGLSGECIRTGKLVYCADTTSDIRVNAQAAADLGLSSALVVPARASGDLTALLEAFSPVPQRFDAEAQQVFTELAVLVAELVLRPDTPARPQLVPRQSETQPDTAAPGLQVAEVRSTPAVLQATVVASPDFSSSRAIPTTREGSRSFELIASVLGIVAVMAVVLSLWLIRPSPKRSVAPSQSPTTTVSEPLTSAAAPVAASVPAVGATTTPKPQNRRQIAIASENPVDQPIAVAQRPSRLQTASEAPDPNPPQLAPTAKLALPVMTASSPAVKPAAPVKLPKLTGGELIHHPQPTYPSSAKALHLFGNVVLTLNVDARGTVASTRVISGNPVLALAAEQAARGWQFRPLLRDGNPISQSVTVTFHFQP